MKDDIKFRQIFDVVKAHLIANDKFRDSDERLVFRIHTTELEKGGFDLKMITAEKYGLMVVNGKVSGWESCTRARRKVQEMYPNLRGLLYKKRKGYGKSDTEINELVLQLLEENAKFRDSDSKLTFRIHRIELEKTGKDLKTISAYEYALKVINGELSSRVSISRCRRKIQEARPELRGLKWKERQARQIPYVEEIRAVERTEPTEPRPDEPTLF